VFHYSAEALEPDCFPAKKPGLGLAAARLGSAVYLLRMGTLSLTGTAALLEELSPFLDDEWINSLLPEPCGPGRPREFSSAQLFRVLLLGLLTPAHSFNLLLALLPENRAWRRFALLHNRQDVPSAKMLTQFRRRLDLRVLRLINMHLLRPLLDQLDPDRPALAIIDSTDLPASINTFKKSIPRVLHDTRLWVPEPSSRVRANGSLAIKNTA
jgi:hypothetical protein